MRGGVYRGYWGSYSGAATDVDMGTGAGNAAGKLHLTIQATPKFTIDAAGKVGIGTTAPEQLFHVTGGNLFLESGTTGSLIIGGIATGNQWRWGTSSAGADLRMYSTIAGTETSRHWFTQSGNVGISTGDVAPIGRLNVRGAGTTSSTNVLVLQNSNQDTIMRVRDDGRMGIGYNGASYGRTINLGGTGINFYTANEAAFGGAVFPTDTSLVLWSNSNSNNYLVLQPSWGNTGIGTYTPNAKFHVNGAILVGSNSAVIATGYAVSIDGRLISEESTVLPSTNWPDYVFDNTYKLMPLEELEKMIRTQKHLPNIPPAATIEKTGIHLGDMTKRLMEKVEELTLYLIELNKENKALAEKLNDIEKKLADK